MSGYSSQGDARQVVRNTIAGNRRDLPTSPDAYNQAALFRAVIVSRGPGYGYSIEMDAERFWAAVRDALRVPILPDDAPTRAGLLVRRRAAQHQVLGITCDRMDSKKRIEVMWQGGSWSVNEDPAELTVVSA